MRNVFLKYALQVKEQLGYISLGQLGSVGVNWGQQGPNGGQPGSSGVKRNQIGLSPDKLEVKWVIMGNVDWFGELDVW